MRKTCHLKAVLFLTAAVIILPMVIIGIWSVTGRWPWPKLLPETYTTRTIKELLFGSSSLIGVLISSIILALIVAIIGTIVAMMTARATEIYRIKGSELIKYGAILPLIVPATVFAMGFQVVLIKMGLNDTVTGVVIMHVIAALPYCVTIMTDITAVKGESLEEQAAVLGAGPWTRVKDVIIPELMPGILSSMSMAFIVSYSQYFTTLIAGGGKIKTLALVMVPYIQSGDRALASVYAVTFVGSALIVFFILEAMLHKVLKGEEHNEA